jgi:branched-chain amino acid transport system ATP-binding protein
LLSGGEQQMLTLARAIASRPAALLVDELSLGLAPIIVDRLLDTLRSAATELGLAVLLVEQQARRAMRIADRWLLLRHGSVVASGDAAAGMEELEGMYLARAL